MYGRGQGSLGYQAAGQAGPEDSSQQGTNGAEGDGGQPQNQQEAGVQGFQGTDFSVHRLLPPPTAYSAHPLQNSDHASTSTHSSESCAQHMPQGSYSDPHDSQPWVGYGNHYHRRPPPSYRESGQRWSNHLHNSTSPDGALSPQPTNVDPSSHLHHPDNSGLYTLCEAAMISSNQQNSGYNYAPNQHPPQPPSLSTPPPPSPPPPYYYHHHMAAPYHSSVQHHTAVAGVETGSVTSPVSPNPLLQPSSSYTQMQLPQSSGILCDPEQPGPSSSFLHQVTSNEACDSEQPGPSYMSQQQQLQHQLQGGGGRALVEPDPDQPGPSFLNRLSSNDAGQAREQQGSSFLHQVPINNVQDSEHPGPSCIMEQQQQQQQMPSEGAAVHTEEDANFPAVTVDGTLSAQDVEGESGSSSGGEPSSSSGGELGSLSGGGPGSLSEAPKPKATSRSKKRARLPKRIRTAFSLQQQDKLEMAYHINPYPDGFVRQQVSQEVGLPESRIQVWFQNRRARGKKQSRTGSISSRSKYRQRRLMANLARHAALLTTGVLPNASSSPLNQAQNIGTAADSQQHYYYLPLQQQQQPGTASNSNDGGDSQQSSQQEQSASNGMSPDQLAPSTLPSPQPDTQQFPPHYHLPSSMAEATAPHALTANSHSVGTAQNMNGSTVPPLPYYPSSASAISMPPPPPPRAYNHTAGTATICYLPHPPASLPPPAPHQSGISHGNNSGSSSSTPSPNLPAPHSNPATLYYLPYPPPPPLPPPLSLYPFHPLPGAAAVSSGNSSSPSPNLTPYTTSTSTTGSCHAPSSDSSPHNQSSISPGQDQQDA